jgi:hypothetical protein
MPKTHKRNGFRNASRLTEIEAGRPAGCDGAEPAGAGTRVPEDHERRRSRAPAFADVRATGFLADGVQRLTAHQMLQAEISFASWQAYFKPIRLGLTKSRHHISASDHDRRHRSC